MAIYRRRRLGFPTVGLAAGRESLESVAEAAGKPAVAVDTKSAGPDGRSVYPEFAYLLLALVALIAGGIIGTRIFDHSSGGISFMPPELIMFREAEMVAAFEARPPDYVCLVQRDTTEYGYSCFGHGYGEQLYGWIVRRYRAVHRIGVSPLEGFAPSGMVLMKLESPAQSARD